MADGKVPSSHDLDTSDIIDGTEDSINDDDYIYYYFSMDDGDQTTTTTTLTPNMSQTLWRVMPPPPPNIWELNKQKSESFYPIFIVLGCVLAIGVLTNVLVCYIYRCRSRRATSNFLVIFFSISDICGCMVVIPMVVTTLALPYSFDVVALCKIVGFVETCAVCSLCMMLTCAALVSYRQLCCSSSNNGSSSGVREAKQNCGIAIIISVLLSIPASIVYDVNKVSVTGVSRIQGEACGPDHANGGWVLTLHYVFVLGSFTVALALMTLFYGLVGVHWCKGRQAKMRGEKPNSSAKQFPKKHRFVREEPSSSSVTACSYSEEIGLTSSSYSEEIGRLHTARTRCHTSSSHHNHSHQHHHHHHHYHSNHQQHDMARSPIKNGDIGNHTSSYDRSLGRTVSGNQTSSYDRNFKRGGIVKSSSLGVLKNSNSQHTNLLQENVNVGSNLAANSLNSTNTAVVQTQTTPSPIVQLHVKHMRQAGIFTVVSIVFVVTMLPYVVVQVLMVTTDVFKSFSSHTTELIVNLCLHTFLINYVVKPMVYIIFNMRFRDEVKQLFHKLWIVCPFGRLRGQRSGSDERPGVQHCPMRSTSNSSIYRPTNTVM